jgi:cytochrome P450
MPETQALPIFPFTGGIPADLDPGFADEPVSMVRLASGGTAYLVARYDDVRRVYTDPVFSRAAAQRPESPVLTQSSRIPHVLLNMDPPQHTRVRRLIVRAFTTGAVERMRARTQEITDELVDGMIAAGPPVDFVHSFATALPALVVSELLGVPGEDRDTVREWLDITLSISAYSVETVQATLGKLFEYLTGLVAAKRGAPAEDLVSGLIAAHDHDDSLSEAELVYTIFILIAGGYETTAGLLTNSLLVLQRHPDQLALLRQRPELISTAIEELLRFVPMARSTLERITMSDTELSGVPIPAGSAVIPLTYSANRDSALLDDPDRLDVTRPPSPHISFGHGVHRCIGAPLALLELSTAYATLFRRLPGLRPAVPESELEWKSGMLTVGPVALPVTW